MLRLDENPGKVYIRNEHDEWEWQHLVPHIKSRDEKIMIAITAFAVAALFAMAFALVWVYVR